MSQKPNIAFIGARGAGKSRLSRKFSKLTGRVALSIDTLISYEAEGLSIQEIVEREGWNSFRDREYEVLKRVSRMRRVIIDCGGGILVEAPDPGDPAQRETPSVRKRELLRESSFVVYVKRDPDTLLGKDYKNDTTRPALDGAYETLLTRRLPLFEEAADMTLDMDRLELEEALELLTKATAGFALV